MSWLARFFAWWRRVYGDAVERERHRIEEDARRYGGKVTWEQLSTGETSNT